MRFLADAGISPKTVQFLSELAHDAVHVRALGLARATDAQVTNRARQESRVLLTFDLDFGSILALGVLDKPSVNIFRLADARADSVNQRLALVLAERHRQILSLTDGAILLRTRTTPYRTTCNPL